MFRQLVLAWVIEPASKQDSLRVLGEARGAGLLLDGAQDCDDRGFCGTGDADGRVAGDALDWLSVYSFLQVRQINSDLTATKVDSGYLPIRRISPVTAQTGGFSALTGAVLAEACALGAFSPRPGTGSLASGSLAGAPP